jgi:hypothetical protein
MERERLKISHLSRGSRHWIIVFFSPEEKLILPVQINKVLFHHFSSRARTSDLWLCININYNFNPLCLQPSKEVRAQLILITFRTERVASFLPTFIARALK